MPDTHKSGGFRLVGRLIPLDQPDDPEKPVFIDLPHVVIVTEMPELHEITDGFISQWITTESPTVTLHVVQVNGTAYILHTGSPPEGYFPPSGIPSFDF